MNFGKLLSTIDTHVAGEAFRIVTNSSIKFSARDVHEANDALQKGFEHERNLLLNEPRGHRGMNGCIVLPTDVADFRLLFFNHREVSNFKYEGLLATVTALIETGTIVQKETGIYTIETVDGIYTVETTIQAGEVILTSIVSRDCVKLTSNEEFEMIQIDGARNYIIYSLPKSIPSIELEHLAVIQRWGAEKTAALSAENIDCEGVILLGQEVEEGIVRSVTFEKDGYILRSPGIDSTFAILGAKEAQVKLKNESIFGSHLEAIVHPNGERKQFLLATEAFVTGTHDFVLDEEDPLKAGFLLA